MDILLGADIFSQVVLLGRRFSPAGTPLAFKTQFGWVLTGSVGHNNHKKICYFTRMGKSPLPRDEFLRKFREVENAYHQDVTLSVMKRKVMEHFKENHLRDAERRFIVPLPLKADTAPLGESRGRAIRGFKNLEKSLYAKARIRDRPSS